ncbi:class I SAM-dependent methyltransferase [Desulfovibrio ferrophilus]|nr:class I SAM-dependent methyltransferase [Desulfovibrio ferrophilus]
MNNEKLRETWDGIAEHHAARKRSSSQDLVSTLYEKSWWKHIEPLLAHIIGGRILEAGCGVGRWVDKLAPMGFEMVLSDFSPNMLQKARESVEENGHADRVTFEVADICDLGCLESDSFHMAVATGEPVTLCGNAPQAISELCRVVRPGGYVLCDASNRYRQAYDLFREGSSESVLQVLETGKYVNSKGLTVHLLGPDELAAVFKEQGMELLTVAGITPLFTFPPSQELKNAVQDPEVYQMLEAVDEKFAQDSGLVHLSSRLIAVARKSE